MDIQLLMEKARHEAIEKLAENTNIPNGLCYQDIKEYLRICGYKEKTIKDLWNLNDESIEHWEEEQSKGQNE